MGHLLLTLDGLLARPVPRQMHEELLEGPVLHSDETPVTMWVEDRSGRREW